MSSIYNQPSSLCMYKQMTKHFSSANVSMKNYTSSLLDKKIILEEKDQPYLVGIDQWKVENKRHMLELTGLNGVSWDSPCLKKRIWRRRTLVERNLFVFMKISIVVSFSNLLQTLRKLFNLLSWWFHDY